MAQDEKAGSEEKSVANLTPGEAKAELAKREAEKMTRRAALAKVGIRGGMAIFAAFSVDDLARKAAAVLSQQSRDNAVVEKVAQQMSYAGVAFADDHAACVNCGTAKLDCRDDCQQQYSNCLADHIRTGQECVLMYEGCNDGCTFSYCDCCFTNSCNCTGCRASS